MTLIEPIAKERCSLCMNYFSKASINFKVPNHRIIDLQHSWGYIREGKRYQNAAFLYSQSRVCVFCSQLFSIIPEEAMKVPPSSTVQAMILKDSSHDKQIAPQSSTSRSDIAFFQKCYQSSTADDFNASIAVSKSVSYVDYCGPTNSDVNNFFLSYFYLLQRLEFLSCIHHPYVLLSMAFLFYFR